MARKPSEGEKRDVKLQVAITRAEQLGLEAIAIARSKPGAIVTVPDLVRGLIADLLAAGNKRTRR